MDISIICSTHLRTSLLSRSLETWIRSAQLGNPDGHTEIMIGVDEASRVRGVMRQLHISASFSYLNYSISIFPVNKQASGSHTRGYNKAVSLSRGDILIFTHPEIMFERQTVAEAMTCRSEYLTYKPLWIPRQMQHNIEAYPWHSPESLYTIRDLYVPSYPPEESTQLTGKPSNRQMLVMDTWESTTTFALSRNNVDRIGPFPEFDDWGPDDPWHAAKRQQLGIVTNVANRYVYHQWHPRPKIGSLREEEMVQLAVDHL